MAETALGLVVDRLKSVLNEEGSLFRDVHEQIRYITNELEAMKSFLIEADVKVAVGEEEDGDSSFKGWVKQVRDLAFGVEDVIDRWTLYTAQQHVDHCGLLHRLCRSVKRLKERHDIAYEVEEIKKQVVEAKERCGRFRTSFSLSHSGNGIHKCSATFGTWHDPRVASLFILEDELVGIERPKDDIMRMLVEGKDQDQDTMSRSNKVISIVGMGGLGKTTLVKNVYDDQRVKMHFDCYAWITVSQSYKTDELLKSMIKQFQRTTKVATTGAVLEGGLDSLGEVPLINFLRELLLEKRYLVVFDDVWKIDFWSYIKLALPENKRGGNIIFTTRNEDVAPSFRESRLYRVYKLEPLPHDKGMELFCKKVFHCEGGCCHDGLMHLSHAMVERCGGLPLAIVSIAGLLVTKDKTVSEWQKLYDGLSSVLTSEVQLASDQRVASLTRVLSLSYHDLPYHLKVSFLYLGMFPEDYSINCRRLIRMWVAQGFVKQRRGMSPEDIAEECLFELISRNLVQVTRFGLLGKARECQVHDLLREIIILPKLGEIGLHHMTGGRDQDHIYGDGTCRHLAIHGWTGNFPSDLTVSQVRSTVLFHKGETSELHSLVSSLSEYSRLLKVVDLQHVSLDYLPEAVGNLWHVRYLSLRHSSINFLPISIGKLHNLEFLDLRNTLVYDLPVEIANLLKLQHLLAYSDNCLDDYNPNSRRGLNVWCKIGCLESLQNLSFIEANGPELISEMDKLKQLRKLGIKKLKAEDGFAFCSALETMKQLRVLKVFSATEEEHLNLHSMSSPPHLLECLHLCGPLQKLPRWILALKDLAKINLRWSNLEEDVLHILQALPNLEVIWLYKACDRRKLLHFPKGSFRKVKVLGIRSLAGLNELLIEDGALPFLEELQLGPFPELKELPSINYLKNLKALKFYDLQKEFTYSLLPPGGCEYWKIEHIPSVLFRYKTIGLQHDTYKLGDSDLPKHLDGSCKGVDKQRSIQLG